MHKIRLSAVNPNIFKAYDIRGKYPEEVTPEAYYKTARAFAKHLFLIRQDHHSLRIVVSRDARSSSPTLTKAFIDGLIDEGVLVIDAGLTTTPMHYFCLNNTNADGGAMITASHLPEPYNGIKLSRKGAVPIGSDSGLIEIRNMALRGIFNPKQDGSITEENFEERYIAFFENHFAHLKHYAIRMVVDASNGMTGLLLQRLFTRFPLFAVHRMHDEIDFSFPHHEANPLKHETLRDVQDAVVQTKSALGVSFDGDGDRIGFINRKGEIVPSDRIAVLFARYLLNKGDAAVFDINSSRAVFETIVSRSGRPYQSRVGHVFMKTLLRSETALFGAENSGHFYFRDFFYADSALFALFSVLSILAHTETSLDALLEELPWHVKSPEINMHIAKKDAALDSIAKYFSHEQISYFDGLHIKHWDEFPYNERWWFVLRTSNTEDAVRLNIEAASSRILEEKKKLIFELLEAFLLS